MAQKHLKELLKEDQEPFYLKDYIANKQCLLKNKQQQLQKIQLNKPKKPTSILPKNTCFFSLQNSPDLRKSPKLFDFPPSPIPNPKSPNKVFLHVPTKTATLLLEAAMRIQKQKSNPKTTHQIKNSGFGLFSNMLKKLSLRNRTQKLKSGSEPDPKTKPNFGGEKVATNNISCSVSSSSSSSCNGRSSSLDLESSISGRSFDGEEDEEFEFTNILKENDNNINSSNNNNGDYYYSPICLSPLSPFRFSLHKSPSPGRCSPAKSPARCNFQGNENYEHENVKKFQEDEEDKEQNSPVSVLDPPFEDDYDGHEDDSYEIECSYAFVHRAQQELLHKLHRFEKLAELDPIELEKRMVEAEEEYELEHMNEFEEYDDHETFTFDEQTQAHDFVQEVIRKTGFQDVKKPGIKRLISDLIVEEKSEEEIDDEQVIKRICNRLESWKEVESNTIDMMVEIDLKKEISDWKKSRKEIDETAGDIEVAIFAELVDKLVEDLA